MDNIWWSQIASARRMVDDISYTLLNNKSIVLVLPESLPWANDFYENIRRNLDKGNGNKDIEIIECPKDDVGKYLFDNYCKKEKRNLYRYSKTFATFLGESDDIVLNNYFIWVHNVSSRKYIEWVNFITDYNLHVKEDNIPAVFVLEMNEKDLPNKVGRGIKQVIFSKQISTYDKYTFCTLMASEVNCGEYLQPYLAELVSSVCANDIELCAECIRRSSDFLKDPMSVLMDIIISSVRSDGSKFIADINKEVLTSDVWKAQVRTVFPAIEQYRIKFVKTYEQQIANILINEKLTKGNDILKGVEKPIDVEIGTLYFWADTRKLLVNQVEHDRLFKLKEARNDIAHLEILHFNFVDSILSGRL